MAVMRPLPLFEMTVPVFQHYLARLDVLLARIDATDCTVLSRRLAPDAFTAGEHFRTTQGFSLRTVFPLIGRPIPRLAADDADFESLMRRADQLRPLLQGLQESDFEAAASRIIDHRAGEAVLSQDAMTFVTLYALPNFFFHLSMGYAIARLHGIELGKADFDGWHRYQSGFSDAKS
jgi:uncharacterized protein